VKTATLPQETRRAHIRGVEGAGGTVPAGPGPAGGAGPAAGRRPGGCGLGGPAVDPGPDRRPDHREIQGAVHDPRGLVPAAPAGLELPAGRTPHRRAGRRRGGGVEEGDLAAGKSTAAALGAWIVFDDETGHLPRCVSIRRSARSPGPAEPTSRRKSFTRGRRPIQWLPLAKRRAKPAAQGGNKPAAAWSRPYVGARWRSSW